MDVLSNMDAVAMDAAASQRAKRYADAYREKENIPPELLGYIAEGALVHLTKAWDFVVRRH